MKPHRMITAFALLGLLVSLPVAAEGWHAGLDALLGRSSLDLSNCRGDCAVVPDPEDASHIGLGFTAEKRFASLGVGGTVRLYDATGGDDGFSNLVDVFVRVSLPVGPVVPYLGAGVSRQSYDARLTTGDGADLDTDVSSPLYLIGVEKRTGWGFWFLEVARTDDELSVKSERNVGGVPVPVAAEFDIERTTVFLGAAFNFPGNR